MSSRGKNHTRGTMQAWRGMAAEGYPCTINGKTRGTPKHPSVLRRNARWRPIARLAAKQAGWTFMDRFAWTYFQGFPFPLGRP